MLLGKRPRPPMRRTTSLTEISFDVGAVDNTEPAPGNPQQQRHQRPAHGVDGSGYARRQQQQQAKPATQQHLYHGGHHHQGQQQYQYQHMQVPPEGLDTRYLMTLVSPRNHQRNSGDFSVEPAHFLRACGLCKRRLGPGRDTYMYRGEVAFCSLECRQQQMNQDERKEKCSLTSMKDPQQAVAAGADAGVDGDTVAAA